MSRVLRDKAVVKEQLECLGRKVRKVALVSQVTVDLSEQSETVDQLDHLAGMVSLDHKVLLEILVLLDLLDWQAKLVNQDSKELLDSLV